MNKVYSIKYNKNYFKKNKSKIKRQRRRKKKDRSEEDNIKYNEYHKIWYKKNKERVRNRRIIRVYGITPKVYKKMIKGQKGKCKICKKKENLRIDHNHTTGKIRGLLCNNCNIGIGLLKDSIKILEESIKYLSQNDKKNKEES